MIGSAFLQCKTTVESLAMDFPITSVNYLVQIKKASMKKNILFIILYAISCFGATALPEAERMLTLSGKIFDQATQEPLTGATIVLEGTNHYAIAGLDGSFIIRNVSMGNYVVDVSFISYDPVTRKVELDESRHLEIGMENVSLTLGTVEVISNRLTHTEGSARASERNSLHAINAISARAIELSPDLTVANVVQRVSGLTVERGSGGEAQYAIVRGMDKRYNYTLVNGIKIPSPDNENRYVPLDIFPAELLDRLVVSKSLIPSMEGDAIGGVVDMQMKSAHSRKIVNAGFSVGYNEIFQERDFDYYDYQSINKTPPMQRLRGEDRVAASQDYYSSENFNFSKIKPLPNYNASLGLGDRFFDNRLGVILAATYQSASKGTDRTQFLISENRGKENLPYISKYQKRRYSTSQKRAGVHNKIDFIVNSNHSISLYNVFLNLQKNQTRVIWEDGLRGINEPTLENNFRIQTNIQSIYNSTLQGDHQLHSNIHADWSLVYSAAHQNVPDNSQLITVSNYDTPGRELRWLIHENQIRIWENNSDRDYAGYYNLTYNPASNSNGLELKTGGLYRIKDRKNSFDMYTFKPNPGIQEYIPYETQYEVLTWRITGGSGTASHALNYQSYENIFAHFLQFKWPYQKWLFTGGVRMEHTDQGFSTANDLVEDGSQKYLNLLPSIHLKYSFSENNLIRASYYKSLSRPSFLEIIPYTRPSTEDIYVSGGNPSLKPVTADNFDLRYELFSNTTDQLLVSGFYKRIYDPIELTVMTETDANYQSHFPSNTTVITPVNFDMAVNYGFELDVIKYFNRFGIRGNYTYTSSEIESVKRTWSLLTEENYDQLTPLQQQNLDVGDSTFLNVIQQRPLQGQSRHLANLSVLYKDQRNGVDAQLSAVYTGERIAVVSTGYETDWWQKGLVQLDFSAEKRFFQDFVLFIKVNNIIDNPYELYIKKPHYPSQRIESLQPASDSETMVRQEYYRRTFLLGIKYKL